MDPENEGQPKHSPEEEATIAVIMGASAIDAILNQPVVKAVDRSPNIPVLDREMARLIKEHKLDQNPQTKEILESTLDDLEEIVTTRGFNPLDFKVLNTSSYEPVGAQKGRFDRPRARVEKVLRDVLGDNTDKMQAEAAQRLENASPSVQPFHLPKAS